MTIAEQPLGVIFDMDGVLIDSYDAHLKTWQICCERHGRSCTEAEFLAGFGRTSREVIRETWQNPPSDEDIAKFDAEKEQLYRDLVAASFPCMPGARELIQSLYDLGIPMAIGSSGPPKNVELTIAQLNIRQQITTVITGADVERGKPHPDVFLKCAQGLGLPAEHCIVLEDAPVGVDAALAAGSWCLGIVSRGRTVDQLQRAHHRVLHDLTAVTPTLLRRIVSGESL